VTVLLSLRPLESFCCSSAVAGVPRPATACQREPNGLRVSPPVVLSVPRSCRRVAPSRVSPRLPGARLAGSASASGRSAPDRAHLARGPARARASRPRTGEERAGRGKRRAGEGEEDVEGGPVPTARAERPSSERVPARRETATATAPVFSSAAAASSSSVAELATA
jgi:hypothetical protein